MQTRLRRIRQSGIRNIIEMPIPGPEKFIWPIFVKEGVNLKEPLTNLPGQFCFSLDRIVKEVQKVASTGIGGVLVFAIIPERCRSEKADYSFEKNGLAQEAVKLLRENLPELTIFADAGLTGYTKNGHAQLLNKKGKFDNDSSLEILQKIGLSFAQAGATGIAPSRMMDGQVRTLRKNLDENGYSATLILSYSTKFNSNLYRTFPFDSSAAQRSGLDRGDYLASYCDINSALRESLIDEEEGADILMVKPGLFYLDIISKLKELTLSPIAVYTVSGEYSMLNSMIEKGLAEKNGLIREALMAIYRAGADMIISYWANQYNEIFKGEK